MSHTPGPWHIDGIFDVRDSQNRKICSITAVGQAIEEVKANAILIKATPDLLEALEGDVIQLANLAKMVDEKQTNEYMTTVYATIARAEGKEPK